VNNGFPVTTTNILEIVISARVWDKLACLSLPDGANPSLIVISLKCKTWVNVTLTSHSNTVERTCSHRNLT
jgi:hypothetical protein